MYHRFMFQALLLRTKVCIPLAGLNQVERPRLTERICEGIKRAFTWELTQLALLRAKVFSLPSDPLAGSPLIEALSTLIAEADSRVRVTPVIEASNLCAYAQHAIAQNANAAGSVSHALTLGAQSGYVRIFADEGKRLLHLLDQYRPQIHAPRAYVEEILNLLRHKLATYQLPVPPSKSSAQQLIPLTRRELDILQLLAAGKSNQEIEQERVLTLNTVKKHVANILSRMGVANRTQAVMLAKKMESIE